MKIKLVLSKKEAEVLHRALDSYTRDTRTEISRTDDPNFRKDLEEEYSTLRSVEDRLVGYLYGTGAEKAEPEEKAA